MGNKGIRCRLADAGPRLEMAFEIVGMKLDQPRRQKITVAVNRACRNIRTAVDRGNDLPDTLTLPVKIPSSVMSRAFARQ